MLLKLNIGKDFMTYLVIETVHVADDDLGRNREINVRNLVASDKG